MKLQTYSETSPSLVEAIERFVRSRTNGMIRGLQVQWVNGEVVLSGRASTYYAKQLATHAAMTAAEDQTISLSNEIEVC